MFGQTLRIEVIDVDRYRREVGRIYLGDRFVNMQMVTDGFAWRYVTYDKPGEFGLVDEITTPLARQSVRSTRVTSFSQLWSHAPVMFGHDVPPATSTAGATAKASRTTSQRAGAPRTRSDPP